MPLSHRGDSGTSVAVLEVYTVFLVVVNMIMKRSGHLKGKGILFEVSLVSRSAGRAKTFSFLSKDSLCLPINVAHLQHFWPHWLCQCNRIYFRTVLIWLPSWKCSEHKCAEDLCYCFSLLLRRLGDGVSSQGETAHSQVVLKRT